LIIKALWVFNSWGFFIIYTNEANETSKHIYFTL